MIGQWVARVGEAGYTGRAHLCESVVNDAAVTRCGKAMAPKATRGQLQIAAEAERCRTCRGDRRG